MNQKRLIIKDIFWYFVGNIIPLMIAFVKSPIYSRIFSPEDFGGYSLVFLTFTYLSAVCYSWIISCAWRYHLQYQKERKIDSMYSNLFFLFLAFSVLIFSVSAIWYFFSESIFIRKLIFLCFLQFFTSEILTLFMVKPRLEGKSLYYNAIQTIKAAGSFALLLLLTFVWDYGIEAFLISSVIFNTLLILVIVVPSYIKLRIKPSLINKTDLIIFLRYGRIGLIINICMLLLISSDRFLIDLFTGLKEVGIYNQNYNIAQISMAMLINLYWGALNPYILPLMENRSKDIQRDIFPYFKMYFFMFFPLMVYFVLFSTQISEIMLGEDFRIGHKIIYWVAIAEFIVGMYFLPTLILKFQNSFKIITFYYTIAIILNIGLNVLFIPIAGYESAAITTVVANLFLFVVFYMHTNSNFISVLIKDSHFKYCILLLLVQCIIHIFLSHYHLSLFLYIVEGILFFSAYVILAIKNKWIDIHLGADEKDIL